MFCLTQSNLFIQTEQRVKQFSWGNVLISGALEVDCRYYLKKIYLNLVCTENTTPGVNRSSATIWASVAPKPALTRDLKK